MKHFTAYMLIMFCIHICTLKLHTYGMHFATQRRFYLFHYVYLLISSYTHLLSQITFWTISDERISMNLLGCCRRRFIGETWIYWKSTSNCFADASVTNKWHDLSTSTIRCKLKWTEASAGVESQSFALPPVGVVVKPQVLAAMFIPGWISKWLVHGCSSPQMPLPVCCNF